MGFSFYPAIGLCFFSLATLALGTAHAASCPSPVPNINMSVQFVEIPPVYNSNFAENIGGHLRGGTSVEITPKTQKSNSICGYISQIYLKVVVKSQIGVSDRYPVGSCQYNVIQAHEAKHKSILMNYFKALPATHRGRYAQLLNGETGYILGQESSVQQTLNTSAEQFKSIISSEHAKLQYDFVDRQDLVKQELSRCSNW